MHTPMWVDAVHEMYIAHMAYTHKEFGLAMLGVAGMRARASCRRRYSTPLSLLFLPDSIKEMIEACDTAF